MKIEPIKVEYVDHFGSDLKVVNCARASFDKTSSLGEDGKLKQADVNLINFLARGCTTQEWDDLAEKMLAAEDKSLVQEILRQYKASAVHFAPFCHSAVTLRLDIPVFVARQLVKHCVTGDTMVSFVKRVKGESNGLRKVSIEYLYNMWEGNIKYQGGLKGKRNVSCGHVKVYDEDTKTFTTSHIVDVIYQGVKPVYLITTETGQTLKATEDHLVMTKSGWTPVKELTSSSHMVTETGVGELVATTIPRWNDWSDKTARRAVVKDLCANCGATENLEADHIIPVKDGGTHSAENMQCLCSSCHKEKSRTEKATISKNGYEPRFVRVLSVEKAGEEKVYDITVEGNHNFLANGLLVHNCIGGTWSEVSRRYVSDEPSFWFPEVWHTRPENVKQGSGEAVVNQHLVQFCASEAVENSLETYKTLLSVGVAPEEARIVLPLNHMTTVVWTGTLLFWTRVGNQRLDPHAQGATQVAAKGIRDIVQPLFPVSWEALVAY